MAITPLDIQKKEFRKAFRGYDEEDVDEFIDLVVREYEKIYKENIELKETLASKDSNIGQYQDLEDTLKKTLVIAQKTSEDIKENAAKEAELILIQARTQADKTLAEAHEQAKAIIKNHEDIQKQALEFKTRLRAMLRSQLDTLSDGGDVAREQVATGLQGE